MIMNVFNEISDKLVSEMTVYDLAVTIAAGICLVLFFLALTFICACLLHSLIGVIRRFCKK